ncbi:acyl-CoA dehydrogenase family protein [Micromonospora sp. NPDC048935]|uniref:acyl-CoA dehydrogenase family protein n=1 Tax=Micromonospora sp. NPDC048935 TaxID=3364262 RepID=UPI0037166100
MIPLRDEQRLFEHELREFFATAEMAAAVAAAAGAGPGAGEPLHLVHRLLGRRGWLAAGWPTRYGGAGRGPVETALVHRELVRHGVPDLLFVVSICYVGNLLLAAAGEAVRAAFLPRLARGELTACTLYSEPSTGSDLASLSCRAEAVPGGFRLSGTKVYSQATEHAGYGVVAARTADPGGTPHDGITLFWMPMDAAGVTVHTTPCLSANPFSRVTLSGVEVPAENVIGAVDEGWPLLNEALSMERTGLEAHLKVRRWLDDIAAHARAGGAGSDPGVAQALAALESEVSAGGELAWEMIGKQAQGRLDGVGAAMSKWYNTEVGRPLARLALDVGLPGAGSLLGEAPGLTLSAGTSEIMLYAIAGGHLRVQTPDAAAEPLDDPDARLRRRLRRFVEYAFPGALRAAGDDPIRTGPVDGGPGPDEVWRALVDSGTAGLTLPRSAGGSAAGLADSVVLMQELGRLLIAGPLAPTLAVAELDGPAAGDLTRTVAVAPPAGDHRPTLADGRLTGDAGPVADAEQADRLLVLASTPAGPALVMVDRDADGVQIVSRGELGIAEVGFADAAVPRQHVVCAAGSPAYWCLLDRLYLRQSGYLLGLAGHTFELTLRYAKGRHQFGRPVATFQHVSFRLAALATRLHAAGRLVRALAVRHDAGGSVGSAAALALVSELARDVTAEGVQLHGAYGYTLAAPVARYYRRAAVETVRYGTPLALRAQAAARLPV